MDHEHAERLAREDIEHVRSLRGKRWHAGEVLVDGQGLSPAWRALPGGAEVHDYGDDIGDDAHAYLHVLDKGLEDIGWWEDGMFRASAGDLELPNGGCVGTWANDA